MDTKNSKQRGIKLEIALSYLKIKYKNKGFVYVCTHCEWNYWLNRYYPKAELIMEIIHYDRK